VGGLGLLAIQFAHALGCEVTAVSSSPRKEMEARALGADHFIVSGDQDSLRQAKFSFDLLLYTAHAETDWTPLLLTLRNNGRLVMIGFSPVPVTFEPLDLIVHQQSITGSFIGSRAAMREMFSFAQAKRDDENYNGSDYPVEPCEDHYCCRLGEIQLNGRSVSKAW
jgi:uncharacterized zinc-type alcohol dehydrogenase-like protein